MKTALSDATYTEVSQESDGFRNRVKRWFGFGPKAAAKDSSEMVTADATSSVVQGRARPVAAKNAPAISPQAGSSLSNSKQESAGIKNSPAPVKLLVEGSDPILLKLIAEKPLDINTFRLADPARYVIDISNIENSNETIVVPELTENPWIKSIRIGKLDGDTGSTMRIVLDLYASDVSVSQSIEQDRRTVSFVLQHDGLQTAMKTGVAPAKLAPGQTMVVLDAGHGGSDPGAQRGDVQEKELTLAIVDKLKKKLESRGVRVRLTRDDDTFVSLEDRVKITNNLQPNAFVSVHINAMETNTATQGIETYFQNDRSRELAGMIHSSLVRNLSVPDRSVRKARFYVINHTPLPAILAEVGFISNKEERGKLTSSDYQAQIASALSDGIITYLAERSQAGGFGTISSLPASQPQQSFTQNLHSRNSAECTHKSPERPARALVAAKRVDEKRKTKRSRQSLKFNRNHLASTRS